MSALTLPPLLAEAGCRLVEVEGQTIVLDQEGHELAHSSPAQAAWLWTASTAALIEHRAATLGFRHELHPERLLVRLWRPDLSRTAAPWQTFPDALTWLGRVERAVARHRRGGLRRVRRPLRLGRCP